MKNLIIVAAGGCGREVLQWAKDINRIENRWNIKGFIDDNLVGTTHIDEGRIDIGNRHKH